MSVGKPLTVDDRRIIGQSSDYYLQRGLRGTVHAKDDLSVFLKQLQSRELAHAVG
jgi:hypothetical protein